MQMIASAIAQYDGVPIRLEDRVLVEAIRLRAGHTLSAHAFASLYLWQESMKLSICLEEDGFFVRIRERGENAWFYPCGSTRAQLDFLEAAQKTPNLSLHYLRNEDVRFLKSHLPGRFSFQEARGDAEYLYLRRNQLDLRGGAYKNLRGKVHRARNGHIWEILNICAGVGEDCEKVIRDWRTAQGRLGDVNVALFALQHYEALHMRGILLRNESGPQGVALGSVIAPGVFDLHVTKTLLPGLDSYLKWELYQGLSDEVEWINQEEDLGLLGLRVNKLESLPSQVVPIWRASVNA